jgi:hypothetical protein
MPYHDTNRLYSTRWRMCHRESANVSSAMQRRRMTPLRLESGHMAVVLLHMRGSLVLVLPRVETALRSTPAPTASKKHNHGWR